MKNFTLLLLASFFASSFALAQNSNDNLQLENNNLSGDNRIDSGGGFMNAGSGKYLQFHADKPLLIKEVEINANIKGKMDVHLQDELGNILDTKSIELTQSGIQNINLGFAIPAGRNYRLVASNFSEDLKLFRNNLNVSYPYKKGNIAVIDSGSGYAFYYYFYNWKVENYIIPTTNANRLTSL